MNEMEKTNEYWATLGTDCIQHQSCLMQLSNHAIINSKLRRHYPEVILKRCFQHFLFPICSRVQGAFKEGIKISDFLFSINYFINYFQIQFSIPIHKQVGKTTTPKIKNKYISSAVLCCAASYLNYFNFKKKVLAFKQQLLQIYCNIYFVMFDYVTSYQSNKY